MSLNVTPSFPSVTADAVAIADVQEHQRAEVANAMHPPEQDDVLAHVGGGQRPAGVGAIEIA